MRLKFGRLSLSLKYNQLLSFWQVCIIVSVQFPRCALRKSPLLQIGIRITKFTMTEQKTKPEVGLLEEDDEFEEFAAEGIPLRINLTKWLKVS